MLTLIVDDNAHMRATIRAVLSLAPGDAVECGDGAEAIDLFRRYRPGWVLMDVSMPVLDGLKATSAICAIDAAARVVIVTDFSDLALRESARLAGAVAFVTKDDLSRLLAIVR